MPLKFHYLYLNLKMALNSVPSPPMPILVKSQSGLIIDCLSIFPLLFPVNLNK